jgi:putative DNA methylase
MTTRKLIEVALPLEKINVESAREKSIRHGHPSTLHLWWARRPLAAARAVLFAQLVDDPLSHPDRFPTEAAQRAERERLHAIIERLVVWENTQDQALLDEAHQEILNSTGGNPPPILDPFAGGGTIPLEAQRLGLEAHASDLNPVAVLINKALIEIPPKFAGQPPIFPGVAEGKMDWPGATGLAADVRAYGGWMRKEAEALIGRLYPKATLKNGERAAVIAWIWARTVTCPNPACAIEMPLVRSWWLSKKKGKEAWVRPIIASNPVHTSGKQVEFEIGHGASSGPTGTADGTVGRTGGRCIACGAGVPLSYIRTEGRSRRLGVTLLAVVAEQSRQRIFIPPDDEQVRAADVSPPEEPITGSLGFYPRDIKAATYGLTEFADLFTGRQLTSLTTFSDLVDGARRQALEDGAAPSYADAVATYLGLGVSRLADIANALCGWENTKTQVRHLFTRQAIPMMWDFAEAPPFGQAAGSFEVSLGNLAKAIVSTGGPVATVQQRDAATRDYRDVVISTDPPYYDNIGYSDLSDFFYVWLRRSLRDLYPELLSTMLVPKAEELVANPYRHGGKDDAKDFFEDGFRRVFERARQTASPDFPITVYYAFKQSDSSEDGTASTGWETLLDGMISAGWAITATWPMRSELANRMMSQGMNALASSIVLALRPRPDDAPVTDRRGLIGALRQELPDALRKLQQGTIAPVDLPQAAIGPGMAVFSRYSRVVENDGSQMTVRSALARINEILDQVLTEEEGDYDPPTRFAIAWYRQHGYKTGQFGNADNLARARNTAVATLDRDGILSSAAGKVTLWSPASLPDDWDVLADAHVGTWKLLQHLIAQLEAGGIKGAGELIAAARERPDPPDLELIKALAYGLFATAEKNGWTQDALGFNNVATSWPEIIEAARIAPAGADEQLGLDL